MPRRAGSPRGAPRGIVESVAVAPTMHCTAWSPLPSSGSPQRLPVARLQCAHGPSARAAKRQRRR
eukprot:11170892-Lingulodinium_polyedra.AAC.1